MVREGELWEEVELQGGNVAGWPEGQRQGNQRLRHHGGSPGHSPQGSLHWAEGQAGSPSGRLPIDQCDLGTNPSLFCGMEYDHLCPPAPRDAGSVSELKRKTLLCCLLA